MYQLPPWVWPVALVTVCFLAVWRGRDDERLAAMGQVLAWAIGRMLYRARSEDMQWAILATDLALLGLFIWLGLRTRRFWPLFAAGFQLLAVITHVARGIDTGVSGWAYQTAELLWSYLVLVAIGYGAWTAPAHAVAREPSADPGATRR